MSNIVLGATWILGRKGKKERKQGRREKEERKEGEKKGEISVHGE